MGGKTTQTATMDPLQERYISKTLMPKAADIAEMEFTPFEGQRVAELTELQKSALGGYGQFATTPEQRQERLMAAQDRLAPMLNRRFAQQGIGSEAEAIRANAFGDRRAVYEGARQAELDALAYDLASKELAAEDAALLQGLGAQMTAGETERGLAQAELDAAYNQYLAEEQFPLTQFSVLTGGSQAFPAGIGTTTTRDPMAGFGMGLQALGGLGMGGFGPFSAFKGLTTNPFMQ